MSKQPLTISEEAKVQMPMKTVASLIAMVAIGTWAFFGVQEKLNQHMQLQIKIMEKDLVEMTFRVQNQMASWITRILTPLIQNNSCS